MYFKKIALISVWVLTSINMFSQPLCSIEHYSSENGLSQNIVMSMIQDKKGFMWFGTWDGLSRFDGYSFKVFKARPGDIVSLSNSRIDYITEDKYGFIWVLTYDHRVHRFNPQTEKFINVPQFDPQFKEFDTSIREIVKTTNGDIWLLGEQKEALLVTTNPEDFSLSARLFSSGNGTIKGSYVNNVFVDSNNNTWLLTSNGISLIKDNEKKPKYLFPDININSEQPFFSFCEINDQIYLGSDNGEIFIYEKKSERFKSLKFPCNSNINGITLLHDRRLLISTSGSGFFVYDINGKSITAYNCSNTSELTSDQIFSTYIDRFGEVWLNQNQRGITHFNPKTGKVRFLAIKAEKKNVPIIHPPFIIVEDINDCLWVHPLGGGFSYYDRGEGCLKQFYNDPDDPDRRFSNMLHSLYSDKQGVLWMCTHSKGIEKVTFHKNNFNVLKTVRGNTNFFSNEIRAVMEDNEHRLWVSSKDGQISVYDKNKDFLGFFTNDGKISTSGIPIKGVVYSMTQDSKGIIWMGTKGNGLYKIVKVDKNIFKIENFTFNADDKFSISFNQVYHIYEDSRKRIWVATFGGGLNLLDKDQSGKTIFINYRNYLNNYPIDLCSKVRYITGDSSDNLYVGTTNGLLAVKNDFAEAAKIIFNRYSFVPGDTACISNNNVHYIFVNKKQETYIATFGGGLNRIIPGKEVDNLRFNLYSISEGLPSDVLLAIQEDEKGKLWISSENGLSRFDPVNKQFENYNEKSFTLIPPFSESSTCKGFDGMIYFGTEKGLLSFYPDSVYKSNYQPAVIFTDLHLFNKKLVPGSANSPLEMNLDATNNLVFKHTENVFSIGFAALDMKNPKEISYAYMLEGFDTDWKFVGDQRIATYTNLPHGEYRLRVKSTNSDGVWADNERSINITLLPSFWETYWAYALYVFILLLVLSTVMFILIVIYRLKHRVILEHQMTEMKLNFFTDISHELRTPLTLISGPLENVLNNENLSTESRQQLELVERNTSRMLRLINQVLDFAKIRSNRMPLNVEEIELAPFAKQIMANFNIMANEHNIEFGLNDLSKGEHIWADADKIEKIIFNLLSNAFKFSAPGKSINIIITDNESRVFLTIKDNGVGIPESKKKVLFERFESFIDKNLFNQSGTGIGLSLVKDMADLHKASIDVESQEDAGTSVKIGFLKGVAHFGEETNFVISDNLKWISNEENNCFDNGDNIVFDPDVNNKTSVLLVEDNSDIRSFLKCVLNRKYTVIEASDGSKGLKYAREIMPDLIICDLMMPGMDGNELLHNLRENSETSHIPVIILTAKSTPDARIECLESGADAFITKPFSTIHLLTRIENLLNQRMLLKDFYLKSETSSVIDIEPSKPGVAPLDQKFMEKLLGLMDKNIENSSLVVDDLVNEMGMSRSVFFKKLKTLTGLAPVDFIKEMRMKRAAQLIETGDYNMTQIAYMVGMNDPRYFSKCFKQVLDKTPSEYKRSMQD